MVTLHKLQDDTYSIRARDQVRLSRASLDEAIRVLMIAFDIAGAEVLNAIRAMESSGDNVAEFGFQGTFVISRHVRYQDN